MRAYLCKSLNNKKRRIVIGLIVASLMVASLINISLQVAFAASPIIKYDGKKADITFENVSNTDLFTGFKGVMPGDKRQQDILIKAKPIDREASFYIKAECDKKTQELLKDVRLTIYKNNKRILDNGMIFDQIKLGTFGPNEEVSLKILAQFPLSLGNEIANKQLHVKWVITVQEDGKEIVKKSITDDSGNSNTKTGDKMGSILLLVLVVIASAMGIYKLSYRKNN